MTSHQVWNPATTRLMRVWCDDYVFVGHFVAWREPNDWPDGCEDISVSSLRSSWLLVCPHWPALPAILQITRSRVSLFLLLLPGANNIPRPSRILVTFSPVKSPKKMIIRLASTWSTPNLNFRAATPGLPFRLAGAPVHSNPTEFG